MVRIRNAQDLCCGLLFLAAATFFFVTGLDLPVGTAVRMGPGYTPRLLCGLIAVVGAILTVRGFSVDGERMEGWGLRPLVFVLGSMLIFAFAIERLGLVITVGMVVVFSSFSMPGARPVELGIVAAAMAAMCSAIFVFGLKLLIPLWPQF